MVVSRLEYKFILVMLIHIAICTHDYHWKRPESLDIADFETFGGHIYLSEWNHTNMNVRGFVLCKSD